MESDLPLLDQDRIARAAEGMIANYGTDALAEAVRRAQSMRFSGCDATAAAWESICTLIKVRAGGLSGLDPMGKKRETPSAWTRIRAPGVSRIG